MEKESVKFSKRVIKRFWTYNEETRSQHNSFHSHIQIPGKIDAKEVRVRKHLSCKSRPLFRNFSHLYSLECHQFKLNSATNAERATWTLNFQHCLTSFILNTEWRWENTPILFDSADNISRRRTYFQDLQATWATTTVTSQGTRKMNDFLVMGVSDLQFEWTRGTTAITCAAIVILNRPKYLLSHVVFDCVFVVGFEANERL